MYVKIVIWRSTYKHNCKRHNQRDFERFWLNFFKKTAELTNLCQNGIIIIVTWPYESLLSCFWCFEPLLENFHTALPARWRVDISCILLIWSKDLTPFLKLQFCWSCGGDIMPWTYFIAESSISNVSVSLLNYVLIIFFWSKVSCALRKVALCLY